LQKTPLGEGGRKRRGKNKICESVTKIYQRVEWKKNATSQQKTFKKLRKKKLKPLSTFCILN